MIISIDIDGVLVDREKYQLEKAIRYARKNKLNEKVVNQYAYNVDEMFGWSKDDFNKFWNEYLWDYAEQPPFEGAREILKKLRSDGHKIIINTSRWLSEQNTPYGEKMRKLVKDWFCKHNLPYDELEFACGDKIAVIKKHNADCHIEDNADEAEPIRKDIPVIIYTAKYNENYNGNNIYRANNWNDVYNNINTIDNIKTIEKNNLIT